MCVLGVGLSFSYVESKKKKAKILDDCWTLLFKK